MEDTEETVAAPEVTEAADAMIATAAEIPEEEVVIEEVAE